jgi:SAM-dependent methyltransferase
MVSGYYTEKLSSKRLRRVYEIAPPRVKQYLRAEIQFLVGRLLPSHSVLELGCGYGRVLRGVAERAAVVVGIDTSHSSLKMAGVGLAGFRNCYLACMDAAALGFADGSFDVVACIQNGISAFGVNPLDLIREAVRVAGAGGKVLFSSYSDNFWQERLNWFHLQAAEGLLGEIDSERTADGTIVCKDGFRATTFSGEQFEMLTSQLGLACTITEVDQSSLFCEIQVG